MWGGSAGRHEASGHDRMMCIGIAPIVIATAPLLPFVSCLERVWMSPNLCHQSFAACRLRHQFVSPMGLQMVPDSRHQSAVSPTRRSSTVYTYIHITELSKSAQKLQVLVIEPTCQYSTVPLTAATARHSSERPAPEMRTPGAGSSCSSACPVVVVLVFWCFVVSLVSLFLASRLVDVVASVSAHRAHRLALVGWRVIQCRWSTNKVVIDA